jgi:mono/diheme cytochrome c family protein
VLAAPLLLAACAQDGDDNAQQEPPPTEDQDGSELVTQGRAVYEDTCALCHGADLKGTDSGPPFLSVIYAPNHHPDESFYVAVEQGVQPHHWDFGPMPPQPAVTREQVEAIVAYIRSQQQAAGITEDSSHR